MGLNILDVFQSIIHDENFAQIVPSLVSENLLKLAPELFCTGP